MTFRSFIVDVSARLEAGVNESGGDVGSCNVWCRLDEAVLGWNRKLVWLEQVQEQMDECLGGICSLLKFLLQKVGLAKNVTGEEAGLISSEAAAPGYGGIDVHVRHADGDGFEDPELESQNMEPYREIIDKTSRRLVDIIPLGQNTIESKEIGNRPELYRKALEDRAAKKIASTEPILESAETIQIATSALKALLPTAAIPDEDVELIRHASETVAKAIEAFTLPDNANLVTPLLVNSKG